MSKIKFKPFSKSLRSHYCAVVSHVLKAYYGFSLKGLSLSSSCARQRMWRPCRSTVRGRQRQRVHFGDIDRCTRGAKEKTPRVGGRGWSGCFMSPRRVVPHGYALGKTSIPRKPTATSCARDPRPFINS